MKKVYIERERRVAPIKSLAVIIQTQNDRRKCLKKLETKYWDKNLFIGR